MFINMYIDFIFVNYSKIKLDNNIYILCFPCFPFMQIETEDLKVYICLTKHLNSCGPHTWKKVPPTSSASATYPAIFKVFHLHQMHKESEKLEGNYDQ